MYKYINYDIVRQTEYEMLIPYEKVFLNIRDNNIPTCGHPCS